MEEFHQNKRRIRKIKIFLMALSVIYMLALSILYLISYYVTNNYKSILDPILVCLRLAKALMDSYIEYLFVRLLFFFVN